MLTNKFKQMKEWIAQSDLVLVGLGEEWVLSDKDILDDLEQKNKLLRDIMQHAIEMEKKFLRELCIAYYYKNYIPSKLQIAYKNLHQLICHKNYYIVSLTVDSYLDQNGFQLEKLVNPCGTYEFLQCENGCDDILIPADNILQDFEAVLKRQEEIVLCDSTLEQIITECENCMQKYRCENCKEQMVFNQLGCGCYVEKGYLENWQKYMKWLQGTLNKKLCVMEFGVGMKLPSVIRFPFEKTVFYNQKSKLIRMHEKYYQINQEVSERAMRCECNAVQFFCTAMVEEQEWVQVKSI